MKRAILGIGLLLLVFGLSFAQQPTNVDVIYDISGTATIIWDEVTEDIDGNPYLPTDTLTYEIFTYPTPEFGVIDDQDPAQVDSVTVVASPTGVVDFGSGTYKRGQWYYVGVRAIGLRTTIP
jgi:hypothetical protein